MGPREDLRRTMLAELELMRQARAPRPIGSQAQNGGGASAGGKVVVVSPPAASGDGRCRWLQVLPKKLKDLLDSALVALRMPEHRVTIADEQVFTPANSTPGGGLTPGMTPGSTTPGWTPAQATPGFLLSPPANAGTPGAATAASLGTGGIKRGRAAEGDTGPRKK